MDDTQHDLPPANEMRPEVPEPPALLPERPLAVRIFMGPSGLRAGWRLFIYVVITVAIGFALGHLLPRHRAFTPLAMAAGEAAMLASVFIAAVVMSFIEHRSVGEYGLPLRAAFGVRFWEGLVWGFVALSALLLGIAAVGDFNFGPLALHGRAIAYFATSWGLTFLLVGFAEEFSMRGYTQFTLTTGMGFWPAAMLLSIVFAALHLGNAGENPLGIVNVFVIGMFFCLTLRRTGHLWFAVGFHAAWDWAESFFYGVPDSGTVTPGHLLSPTFHGSHWITGGNAGPEGSVLCLALIGVLALLVHFRFPEARYCVRSSQTAPDYLQVDA